MTTQQNGVNNSVTSDAFHKQPITALLLANLQFFAE